MKHLNAINRKAARVEAVDAADHGPGRATSSRCSRAASRRSSPRGRTFRRAARSSSRPGGKPTARAARRASASRSSATCSTATWAATGRRRCPTSSTTRPTGPPSAPRPRRTGGRSIWCFRDGRAGSADETVATAGSRRLSGARAWPRLGRSVSARRASRRQAPTITCRQRQAVHRHLQGRHPDLRRGDREARGPHRPQDRAAAFADAVAGSHALLRARLDLREDRGRRDRDAQDAQHLHAEQRQQAHARDRACRPIR